MVDHIIMLPASPWLHLPTSFLRLFSCYRYECVRPPCFFLSKVHAAEHFGFRICSCSSRLETFSSHRSPIRSFASCRESRVYCIFSVLAADTASIEVEYCKHSDFSCWMRCEFVPCGLLYCICELINFNFSFGIRLR